MRIVARNGSEAVGSLVNHAHPVLAQILGNEVMHDGLANHGASAETVVVSTRCSQRAASRVAL
jgi:hypothetical protein